MRYDSSGDSVEIFEEISNINEIIETGSGEIFVGTNDGVVILKVKSLNQFVPEYDRDTLLTNQMIRVYSMVETRSELFWIGTEGA